ncbi:S-adenosyl-L-methionine-dependent methyltransferase [Annulohypoxylon moriforme]|nr:S-adenosyl-L-methionine-dependent methyltransferase [Annulohypoxylon moriforme]
MSNSYHVDSFEAENKRLEQGSETLRAYMNGNVFLAPIDTARSNLRVLDSAASNGYWLSQIQAALKDSASATLIGTDLQNRFPDPPRQGISLRIQNINAPWPEEWKGSFDYVHQALVLFQAGTKQREAVAAIGELVKPGGWIELMEPEYEKKDGDGKAFGEFQDMMAELWGMRGVKSDFAKGVEGLVKQAGFVDVREELLPVGIGPMHKDPKMREVSVESTVGGGRNIVTAEKLIPGGLRSISKEDFKTWPDRFEKELRTEGAIFHMRVVYGRKPEA